MAIGKQVPDKTLLKSVNQKILQRSAGGGAKVTASVASGTVTLQGVLGMEYQRRVLISSLNGVTGVKRVVDMMTVTPPKKRT